MLVSVLFHLKKKPQGFLWVEQLRKGEGVKEEGVKLCKVERPFYLALTGNYKQTH